MTYEAWEREIEVFDREIEDLEDEKVAEMLLRGLVLASTLARQENPEHANRISLICMNRLMVLRDRMGDVWFFERLHLVRDHSVVAP